MKLFSVAAQIKSGSLPVLKSPYLLLEVKSMAFRFYSQNYNTGNTISSNRPICPYLKMSIGWLLNRVI